MSRSLSLFEIFSEKSSMPLSSSSLLFADALGPLFGRRRGRTELQRLSSPCCRRAVGEASSSSSSSSRKNIKSKPSRSIAANASSTPPPPNQNSNNAARSFDGEDELDTVVSAELAQYIDPERAKQEQKRLELAWAVRAKVRSFLPSKRGGAFFPFLLLRRRRQKKGSFVLSTLFSFLFTPPPPPPPLPPPLHSYPFKQRKTPSAPCDCCGGSGTCGCEFCRGSGALTVGAERFCSLEDGCKECPACSGRGSVPCDACKGTGQRAAWLGPGCPVDD